MPAHPEGGVDVVAKHAVVETVLVVDSEDEVPGQGGQQLPQLPRAAGGTRPVLPRDRSLGARQGELLKVILHPPGNFCRWVD